MRRDYARLRHAAFVRHGLRSGLPARVAAAPRRSPPVGVTQTRATGSSDCAAPTSEVHVGRVEVCRFCGTAAPLALRAPY
eukprot:7283368-Alexandrium_andersonii.AAC.1